MRFGLAAMGIVDRKLQIKRRRSKYEVTYTAARTSHKAVGIADSAVAEAGGSLTVLYDSPNPERAAIYAAVQYQANKPR